MVPKNDVVALAWLWRVNLRWMQKILDEGPMSCCGIACPTRVFFGGDSLWLHHVLGITTHWMVARLYNFGIWQDGTLVGFDLKRSAAANAMWHELVRTKQL